MEITSRAVRLIVINGSPLTSVGGVQIFSRAMLSYAAEHGCPSVAITSALHGEASIGQDGPVTVYRLRSIPLLGGRFPVPSHIPEICRLASIVRMATDGVVIVQTRLYILSLIGAALAFASGRRCLVIEHGSGHIKSGNPLVDGLSIAYEHVATIALKLLRARFYAVSPAAAQWLTHFGIRTTPIVSNGVDDALLVNAPRLRSESPFVISFVGRLIPEKGVSDLLLAFQQLDRRSPGSYRLEIVGEGPMLEVVREAAAENHRIIAHGPLEHSATMEVVASSDAFVSPTRYPEGFNRGLIEAGALARPIVATLKGETSLLRDGDTALIVDPSNPTAIVNALERLRQEPGLARSIGDTMQKRVREAYRWSAILDRFWDAEISPGPSVS